MGKVRLTFKYCHLLLPCDDIPRDGTRAQYTLHTRTHKPHLFRLLPGILMRNSAHRCAQRASLPSPLAWPTSAPTFPRLNVALSGGVGYGARPHQTARSGAKKACRGWSGLGGGVVLFHGRACHHRERHRRAQRRCLWD